MRVAHLNPLANMLIKVDKVHLKMIKIVIKIHDHDFEIIGIRFFSNPISYHENKKVVEFHGLSGEIKLIFIP